MQAYIALGITGETTKQRGHSLPKRAVTPKNRFGSSHGAFLLTQTVLTLVSRVSKWAERLLTALALLMAPLALTCPGPQPLLLG